MPEEQTPEYLVIAGRLDRAGRFTPRRCRSTTNVREWPVIEESDVVVELLDADQRALHRELAQVTPDIDCDPGDAKRFRVLAYIELRPDATAVRLRRDDLVLWLTEIPPAPRLRVTAPRARPDRKRSYELGLRYSDPYEGAFVTVVYQWGERRFQTIHIGPPTELLRLQLNELPGGTECRFVVAYSNGLRSTGAATRTFSLPPLGPSLTIARPASRERVLADTPVHLEGHVTDPERPGGARPEEHLVWLVDGEEIGRGPLSSVDALDVGAHDVTLRYEAEKPIEATVRIRVTKPRVPTAQAWAEWDPTDDRFV
jgi:hypothetical protein